MALWGILFGVVATVAGLLLVGSVTGGFVAEGFFLIVLSWVLVFLLLAKLVTAFRNRNEPRGGQGDLE